MRKKALRLIPILLVLGLLILTTSARGCPKRGRNLVGSSNNIFIITAPSNLTAVAVSPYQIDLTWQDNSNNEDGFEIERKLGAGGAWQQIEMIGSNVTSYSDTGLFPMTVYYYRIRAYNTIGDRSDYSNEASAITLEAIWFRVAAGDYHSIAVTGDGTIWTWGQNRYDQLGLGDSNDRTMPTLVTVDYYNNEFGGIDSIAAGLTHSIARKTDGTIWTWGANGIGQLGLGDTQSADAPFPVGSDSDWAGVTAGGFHSLAIKTNGTIWGWGGNDYGQLGVGDTISRTSPSQVGTDSDWSIVRTGCANGYTLAIKNNNVLWSWGANTTGQLGLGDSGEATNRKTPTQVGTASDWSAVVAGNAHTIACKTNLTLWGWGYNMNGQLGLNDIVDRNSPTQIGTLSDWSIIAAGGLHTVAINGTTRSLWAWGNNGQGQLGLGDSGITRRTPTQVGTDSDWFTVAVGFSHTLAIKTDNTIWSWGFNYNGQLGLGDNGYGTERNEPIRIIIGIPNSPVLLTANIISSSQFDLSWTDLSYNEDGFKIERKITRNGNWNEIGEVSANITYYSDVTSPAFAPLTSYYYRVMAYNTFGNSAYTNEAIIALSGDWVTASIGNDYTVGQKTNGTIWSSGKNKFGQLGLGDINVSRNTLTQIGTASDWSMVVLGSQHTIACKTNRTLWAWGLNDKGQLGLGDQTNRSTPTQVGTLSDWLIVTVGEKHSLARKTNGNLWSWGQNNYGQLGLGNTSNRYIPTQIDTATDWVAIAGGYRHSIAIKNNGTLWIWGLNNYGQLGLGDTGIDRWTPTQIGTNSDWSIIAGSGPDDGTHSIACKTNGTIWGWGRNDVGQLGLGDVITRTTPSQIGIDSGWSMIAVGSLHTISLKTNASAQPPVGTLWVWGQNTYGQLGLGDSGTVTNRTTPTQLGIASDWLAVSGANLSTIAAGADSTICRKTNGTLWAWGRNDAGQLGLGDYTSRNIPTLVGE